MKEHILAIAVFVAVANLATAQIDEIGPFEGELFDGFESLPSGFFPEIDVFGGQATVGGMSGDPAVFVVHSSTFFGVTVFPHTGALFIGGSAPLEWRFDTPGSMFGGYFATNSGANGAVADFFDTNDALIASVTVTASTGGPWVWNGWASDIPFKRIVVTGNGGGGAFFDYDDMQLTSIPEPASAALLGLGVAAMLRRRRVN